MAAQPFESRLQDLVYNVDVGVGRGIIKFGLYIIFILFIMLFYTVVQFKGLNDEEAMDYAQLGRNLMQHKAYVTQCIRPASIAYLRNNSPSKNPRMEMHPDILHPPLYPLALAAGYKISGVPFVVSQDARSYPAENRVIIPLGHLFTILTGVLVFFIGRLLFDRRVASVGITVYYLSNYVWHESISGLGLSMVTFLVTAAFYLILKSGFARSGGGYKTQAWLLPFLLSALACVAAFLTRYGAVVVLPALVLYIYLSYGQKSWMWALIFLLIFMVGISPWLMRNKKVSGGVLGLAAQSALIESSAFEGDSFMRTLEPDLSSDRVLAALRAQWVRRISKYYNQNLKLVGDGFLICFFIVTFFYAFIRPHVQKLRWCLALGMILLIVLSGIFGDRTMRLMLIFWPFIILYGLAFFFILLDRFEFTIPLINMALTGLFILLCALPLIFALLPPRKGIPYPPYFQPYIIHISNILKPDELMCSDMPWATAWYGQRNSLQLPQTLDEFYVINDMYKKISGIYFTTLTRNKPYIKSLRTGADKSWFPILERRIPADFPLTDGFPIADLDQIFLTDRERLKQ